jgi:hypothetical protein
VVRKNKRPEAAVFPACLQPGPGLKSFVPAYQLTQRSTSLQTTYPRQIDAALDLCTIRRRLAPYHTAGGRPSIDPELMIRMLLVGNVFAIRSERRLCEEVHPPTPDPPGVSRWQVLCPAADTFAHATKEWYECRRERTLRFSL